MHIDNIYNTMYVFSNIPTFLTVIFIINKYVELNLTNIINK